MVTSDNGTKKENALWNDPEDEMTSPLSNQTDIFKISEAKINDLDKISECKVLSEKTMTRNICLFVANICLVNMFYMILTAYTNGVVRTLERRFGLSSYQTGFLNSCNDIVHIMVVVFVGYFGQKGNKPRIMSVTAMFSAMSGILNASPHFIFSDSIDESTRVTRSLNETAQDRSPPHHFPTSSTYCRNFIQSFRNNSNRDNILCPESGTSIHPAYYVFLVSQLINGIGSSAIFTLSMAYIDENSPKNKASLFIGAYTSLYSLGPVFGLFLSSLCLKLPENLLSRNNASSNDPSFVGCWWLGYLIGGIGLAIFSTLLWFHPSDSRYKRTVNKDINLKHMKRFQNSDSEESSCYILAQLRGIRKAIASLLKNKLYLINLCIIVSGAYTIYGVFVNVVRYMEVHFFRSAAESSVIAGSLLAVTGFLGGFLGGSLISKLRLKITGGIKLVLCLSFIFLIGLVILINLECPQVKMDITLDPNIKAYVVKNQCNRNCGCSSSRTDFYPICGNNNITYFSPCMAGCSRRLNDTFLNCKCIISSRIIPEERYTSDDKRDGEANLGFCEKHCAFLLPFIATMFFMSFASTMAKVPSTMVTFRVVKDEERAFALGVNSFVLNLCGFIPGPLVFGKLIDSACLLWQRNCGTTGACLLFDTNRLRKYTYGASLFVEFITFSGNFCLLLMVKKSVIGRMLLSRQSELVLDVNL